MSELDRAMAEASHERTVRHDPHDVWEALGALYALYRGLDLPLNQSARLAMADAGCEPRPRYRPVDLARTLGRLQREVEGLREQNRRLTRQVEEVGRLRDLREMVAEDHEDCEQYANWLANPARVGRCPICDWFNEEGE